MNAKVVGAARYADDLTLPRMAHGKLLRSPHARARIRAIDVAAARALPGVLAVITGRDLPVRYGILPWTEDEHALANDEVSYVGEAVAAVAAVDARTAERALAAIAVDYEVLPAVLLPEEALAHPEIRVNPSAREGNVSKRVDLTFGDVAGAFATAEVVLEAAYSFESTTHAALEPHCAVADADHAGNLTLYTSTQVPHYVHRTLAKVLGVPAEQIRVIQPTVGGGFGGKSEPFDLELCAAKLALLTRRPVKIRYSREEVFYAHRGRHAMKMRFRTAATREGKLLAVASEILIDGGARSSFGVVTTYYSGQLLAAPYHLPAYAFHSTRVFTNKPACGPKRGHGSVQPRFAFEVQLDELAETLAIDPIELRRRNALGADVTTVNGQRIGSNGFLECLDKVERASGWREKFGKLPLGRGVGVAGSTYISGTAYPIYPNEMPQSSVIVKLDRSGQVLVTAGVSEIGQGVERVLAELVARELGCALSAVRVVTGDTQLCPVDLGAYSSRLTLMAGNAAIEACASLREKLDRALPFAEAVQQAEARHGTLVGVGAYRTQKLGGEYRGGGIGASPAYSFTAHVAEVDVDVRTGFVRVVKLWVAHDCGRAINRTAVAGQIEGSAAMAFGEALLESHVFRENGMHHGPNLLDYKLATTLDTPEIEALIVEAPDPAGPHGAKEAGEGPLHPGIPAIANAIHDAIGVRLRDLPLSPERVLAAWRAR